MLTTKIQGSSLWFPCGDLPEASYIFPVCHKHCPNLLQELCHVPELKNQEASEQDRSIKIDCGEDKTKAMAPLPVNGMECIFLGVTLIHLVPLTGSGAIALVLSTPQSLLIDLCCSKVFWVLEHDKVLAAGMDNVYDCLWQTVQRTLS